ncbi:MAG: 3-dehydroquinate synthase [Halobacteriovoraceae bacterium]|nr:3-dehydroquinate synthase [Halobacteriovoraceae bacterium]
MIKKASLKEIIKEISGHPTDTILWFYDKNLLDYQDKFKITGKHVIKFTASVDDKSFYGYQKCCEFFLSQNIHPKSHLISMGGGSINDLAGFAASTLFRGISWSTIPTSILAMIDASIGGKVAIDTPFGKNLLGNMHFPQNIWIDPAFLSTLPQREYKAACGELIKYAFLNEKIARMIFRHTPLEDIIYECAFYKERVVNEDSPAGNKRLLLNLGHTMGHALEAHYKIPHGIAVFWGIPLELKLLGRHHLIEKWLSLAESLFFDREDFIPPWNQDKKIKDSWIYISKDKKRLENNKIVLVDIKEIGEPETIVVDLDFLKKEMEHPYFANII